jgi:hypothetical protein
MKTSLAIYGVIIGLLSAPGLTTTSNAAAQPQPRPFLQLEEPDDQELISGIVKNRTADHLVVTDPTDEKRESRFTLTSRTKYFKDGREARAEDITVGARVQVKVSVESDDKLEALEVTIIKSRVVECFNCSC